MEDDAYSIRLVDVEVGNSFVVTDIEAAAEPPARVNPAHRREDRRVDAAMNDAEAIGRRYRISVARNGRRGSQRESSHSLRDLGKSENYPPCHTTSE